MARRTQLRIYTLDPARAEEFVRHFAEQLVPLRTTYGFSIDAAWLAEDHTRFTWVTSHDCPDGWDAAEAAYYNSPERTSFPFNPGEYIIDHDVSMVVPVTVA
jgi:hypothetical protein